MKKMELVRSTLNRFVSSGQIAGCAVRIMQNDEVRYEGSFGYADIESKVPMRSGDTIFPIASMSKVITVAGIMQLYEQGLFSGQDPHRKGKGIRSFRQARSRQRRIQQPCRPASSCLRAGRALDVRFLH